MFLDILKSVSFKHLTKINTNKIYDKLDNQHKRQPNFKIVLGKHTHLCKYSTNYILDIQGKPNLF
jgi:hypothetical protein